MHIMAEVPEKLTIYGGLNTSTKTLDRLANAIIAFGFVASSAEVNTIRLDQAGRQPFAASEAAEESLAVAHSMGNLIWGQILARDFLPHSVMSLNPIRPESLPKLGVGGVKRFAHHATKSFEGHNAQGHRQILADTIESIRHPLGNLGRVSSAVEYDSVTHLSKLNNLAPVVGLVSLHDEFGPAYRLANKVDREISFAVDPIGCHDTALYDPNNVLGLIAKLDILPQTLTT
jgi:hypothetical protein